MSIHSIIPGMPNRDPALHATRSFMADHADALLAAAALLGGTKAHSRCLRLVSDVASAQALSRHLKRELVWLHRFLMLEHVGDPESEETARFMSIDLLDPQVEEICLEADRLFDLLVAISEMHPTCDVILPELFDLSAA